MSLPAPFKEISKRMAEIERRMNEQEEAMAQLTAQLEACKRKKPGQKPKVQDAE